MDAGWAMDGPPSKETKSSSNRSWEFPGSPRNTARTTEKAGPGGESKAGKEERKR